MNKLKKTISVISVMSSVLLCGMRTDAEEYCETIKYIITDDKAIVTGFTGNPKILNIPAKIDGKEVVQIRENAFYKCESLEKIILPDTVKFVGHHAFFNCTSLEEVELSDNIYSIDEGCFSGCISLEKISFSDNLKVIENDSFFNCQSLEKVEFPSGFEEIGDYAFADCKELSDISFGDKLMNIGDFAFFNCENLSEIRLPSAVTSIGGCAFGYSGEKPEIMGNFKIVGSEDSLGKIYAESNGMMFEDSEYKKSPKKISAVPVMAAIISGAGLLFFQFLEKLKGFKRKYEYEC